MFTGTFTPSVDDKGRLFLPAKMRVQLAEGVVVTKGQERCLVVWKTEDFMQIVARVQEAPITNKGARDYARMVAAGASETMPDKQGRISLPQQLRDYASITKDCVVIGAINRVEIWEPQAWADYNTAQEDDFANLSEEVFPGI